MPGHNGHAASGDAEGRTPEPLHNSPALRTRDAAELTEWLRPTHAVSDLDIRGRGLALDSRVNHRTLSTVSLSYMRYGAPISVRLTQTETFMQGFPLLGTGEVLWGGVPAHVGRNTSGIVGGPGQQAILNYSADFAHIVMTVAPATLTRKLSALIDAPVDPPLQMMGRVTADPKRIEAQSRLVQFLADEADQTNGGLPPAALAEVEQSLLISFLHAAEHNYRHLLDGEPRAAAPWQVRRALDYIEQNWDQPITIEALALVTHTSVRSLFHLFKKSRGVSPMVFVKQVRLRHARAMLSRPEPGATVTSVAFLCGFSNMGHFAKDYVSAFGEKPSVTLGAAR